MTSLDRVHARLDHHDQHGPPIVLAHLPTGSAYQRFNRRAAIKVTQMIGSMTTAWLFCLLALCSLPAVLSAFHLFHGVFPGWLIKTSLIALIAWIAQTFIQLVALSIIIVGQNIAAEASDKRAQETLDDTVAIQHATLELHALLECVHTNPQTGPCLGHPDFGIAPSPVKRRRPPS